MEKTTKARKTSLQSILKDSIHLNTIQLLVSDMNKLVQHTYQFIRLFFLHCFEQHIVMPTLSHIMDVFDSWEQI